MKPKLVSAIAVLICCAILTAVGVFGYTRYKAAQSANAAFSTQLQTGVQTQAGALGTRMPDELQSHPVAGEGQPAGSPAGGQ